MPQHAAKQATTTLQRSTACSTDSCVRQVSVSALTDPTYEDAHRQGAVNKQEGWSRHPKPRRSTEMLKKERSPQKRSMISNQRHFAELPPRTHRHAGYQQQLKAKPSTLNHRTEEGVKSHGSSKAFSSGRCLIPSVSYPYRTEVA